MQPARSIAYLVNIVQFLNFWLIFQMFPAFASAWLPSLLSFLHWVDEAPIVEDEESSAEFVSHSKTRETAPEQPERNDVS